MEYSLWRVAWCVGFVSCWVVVTAANRLDSMWWGLPVVFAVVFVSMSIQAAVFRLMGMKG